MEFTIAKQFLLFKHFSLEKIISLESENSEYRNRLERLEKSLSEFEQALRELNHRDEETIINAWFSKLPRDKNGNIENDSEECF